MVVRGGYGTYYNSSVYTNIANNMAQQPPFAQTLSIASSPDNPLTLQNGFMIPAGHGVHQHLRHRPELPHRLRADVADLRAAGSWATRWSAPSLTTALRAPGSIRRFCPIRLPRAAKPNGLPAGFLYEQANGNSIYHGATAQIMRRFRNGVSFNASYTLRQGYR